MEIMSTKGSEAMRHISLLQAMGIAFFTSAIAFFGIGLRWNVQDVGEDLRRHLLEEARQTTERIRPVARLSLLFEQETINVRALERVGASLPSLGGLGLRAEDGSVIVNTAPYPIPWTAVERALTGPSEVTVVVENADRLLLAAPILSANASSGVAGLGEGFDFEGSPEDAARRLIGSLAVWVEKSAMNQTLRSIQRKMMLTAALVSVGVFATVMLAFSWITKPIRTMASVIGHPDTVRKFRRTPVFGVRETRSVTRSFNQLMERFEALSTELEQRVASRTRELASRNEELARANEAKSLFLSKMSHEIRTPLNGVVGAARMLVDAKGLAPQQRRCVETIQDCSNVLVDLIEGVLDLSKADRDQLRIEHAPFDLHETLTRVVGAMTMQAAEKGLSLRLLVDPRLTAGLIGDRGRLTQVLTNLLGNAVKFTETGGVTVRVSSASSTAPGRVAVLFEVEDTGIGIPEQAQPRVFQYFEQVDDSRARRYGGAGIGTALSKNLVEAMGGRIGFESTPGIGSRFWWQIAFDVDPDFTGDVKSQCAERIAAVIALGDAAQESTLREHLHAIGIRVIADAPAGRQQRVLSDPELWERGHVLIFSDERQAMTGSVQRLLRLLPRTDLVQSEAILVGAGLDSGLLEPATFGGYITDPDNKHEVGNAVRIQCQRWFVGGQPDDLEPLAEGGGLVGSLNVLVAEDNATNQFVIRMVLEKAGHTVEVAEDGTVALQALGKRRFDAILLDMHMPGMDGIDVARQFARDNPGHGIPIVMLTADSTADARAEAKDAGVDEFLTKPMDPRALLAALDRGRPSERARRAQGPVLDTQILDDLQSMAGSPSSGYELAMRFLDDCERGLSQLAEELPGQDWQALKRRAHAVKGCAASAGATRLREASVALEQAARQQDSGEAEKAHGRACVYLDQARDAIKAHFG